MDNEISVKFGADIAELQRGMGNAKAPVADFSARVADLNAQLAALDRPLAGVSANAQRAADATKGLSFATAGATREFLVLGHELVSGNFSRMPGSLIVLAERTGGLHDILQKITPATVAWTAAIGATVAGLYEWAAATEHLAEVQNTIRGAMELNNQSLSYNADAVEQNMVRLRALGDMGGEEAEKIAVAFARAGGVSDDLRERLIRMVADYAAATGEEAPRAAGDLIRMFTDPAKGIEELSARFKSITPEQVNQVELMAKNGASAREMGDTLANILAPQIDNFREQHLTPLQKALEDIHAQFVKFSYAIGHEGTPYDFSKEALAAPASGPEQSDAAAEQQHQNELNDAEMKGLATLKTVHGEHEQINQLMEKRQTLLNAANAAMEKGDDDLAAKYQQGMESVDAEIARVRQRYGRQSVAEARKSLEEGLAIERDKANTQAQLGRIELQDKQDALQEEVAANRVTKEQALTLERQYAQQEYDVAHDAYLKELDLDGQSALQKQQVYDKIQVLFAQHMAKMSQLNRQEAQAAQQSAQQAYRSWLGAFKPIETAFDGMLTGILQGTQTIGQAMANAFADAALSIVESIVKIVAEWLIFEAVTEGQGSWNDFVAIQGGGGGGGGGFLGGIGKILGFADGTPNVQRTGIAMIHQGEMIIPARPAQAIRDGAGFGTSGGDSYHFHITAVDAPSVKKLFMDNGAAIAASLNRQARNFNPNTPWKAA